MARKVPMRFLRTVWPPESVYGLAGITGWGSLGWGVRNEALPLLRAGPSLHCSFDRCGPFLHPRAGRCPGSSPAQSRPTTRPFPGRSQLRGLGQDCCSLWRGCQLCAQAWRRIWRNAEATPCSQEVPLPPLCLSQAARLTHDCQGHPLLHRGCSVTST